MLEKVQTKKKHFTQMTPKEVELIKSLTNDDYTFTDHSKLRTKNRHISQSQVLNTIRYGEIVEYFIVGGNNNRVMFRSPDGAVKGRTIYVVADVISKVVVTAYKDKPYRNSTSSYDKSIDICKNIEKAFNFHKCNSYKLNEEAIEN